MTTIKDIAERAGVSTTTVSNVIHGKTKKVSPENVAKIQKLIDEMGYVQKMGLRVLNNESSQLIAVIINYHNEYSEDLLSDPFYGKILGAIEERLRLHGYYMMFYASSDMDDIFKMVMSWDVDGVITITFSRRDCEKIYHKIHKPVVSIDSHGIPEPGMAVANIGLDDERGGYLMAKYLIERGYETIYVCGFSNHGSEHLRWLGASRAAEEIQTTGKKIKLQFLFLNKSAHDRERDYEQMAKQIPFRKKTAAFFLADFYALEAVSIFSELGISIPDQIGIAGYDDILYARLAVPKLTTIRQDIREKAHLAADGLVKCLTDQCYTLEPENKLPVSLIIRQST